MRLVRSGEGETLTMDQLEALARRWYGDRLDPRWRPRALEDSQAILAGVGLEGPFWDLRGSRGR